MYKPSCDYTLKSDISNCIKNTLYIDASHGELMQINKVEVPQNSRLNSSTNTVFYSDAFSYTTQAHDTSVLAIWLWQMESLPIWVKQLMQLRNKLAFLFGIQNTQSISKTNITKPINELTVGDRVGFFVLEYLDEQEAVLVDKDTHLTVKISIYKPTKYSNEITISSQVIVHNMRGRIYMFFVAPMHRLIVPASIRRAEKRLLLTLR